jgi:hypothetical protein
MRGCSLQGRLIESNGILQVHREQGVGEDMETRRFAVQFRGRSADPVS